MTVLKSTRVGVPVPTSSLKRYLSMDKDILCGLAGT